MAVAFDAAASSIVNGTALTFAHTCTGTDRALGVGVTLVSPDPPSGVTYNGVAMALEASRTLPTDGDSVHLYKLENPAAGAHDVVVTIITSSADIMAGSVSVTGADQTDCISNSAVATGTSASPSVAVTSAVGELVMSVVGAYTDVTGTAGTGETERWELNGPSSSMTTQGYTEAGAATVTVNPSLSASNEWAIAAMSFRAAAAGLPDLSVGPSQIGEPMLPGSVFGE